LETALTPLEFARRARKLYGNREAVVDGDLRMTYEQFFDRCDRWSAALQALGVKKGDRVAYIAPNTHEQLESFYAVPQTGAVLVPINYRLTPEDFVYITTHSGAKVLCVHPDHMEAVDSVRSQLGTVEHFVALGSAGGRKGWSEYEASIAANGPDFKRPEIAEGDLLSLNYTSGTTAKPKGVMITHRNAWMNVVGTLVHLHLGVDDRYLWTLPMFHANGWTFVWIVTAVGGTHVCLPKVDPARVFELIRTENRRRAPVDRAVIKARTGVELITSGDLRVVNDSGADVAMNGQELGEIVVQGNVVMEGYYNDPEATKKVMGDGWFHTGDAAVIHPDGYVEIRDRIKDVIISGGENISSVEVEGVLLRHPSVQEAAIVGLPHEKWGEAPFAFVVLKPGETATEQELIEHTRSRLAHFKAPHGVTFVTELPKTATGKIQKYVLRKGAAAIVRQ
jgi:acyl-CoA synthetase (AMP-forming)/AMP-acid ligase II